MEREVNGGNKVLFFIVLILLISVLCIGGFFAGKWYAAHEDVVNNKEENKEKEPESESLKKPERNAKYSFYTEKEETIKLGDEEVRLLSYYYIDSQDLVMDEVTSKYYVLRRQFYADNTLVADNIIDVDKEKSNLENIVKDKMYESLNKFDDKTSNDQYAALELLSRDFYIYDGNNLRKAGEDMTTTYVLNDEGKILKSIVSKKPYYGLIGIVVDSSSVKDRYSVNPEPIDDYDAASLVGKKYIYPNNRFVDVHDNFIYYIVGDCTNYFEYKMSIEDESVREESIYTYYESQIMSAGGC